MLRVLGLGVQGSRFSLGLRAWGVVLNRVENAIQLRNQHDCSCVRKIIRAR